MTEGADAIVAYLSSYYSVLDPDETVERWIHAPEDVYVWHGTIEPDTEYATPFCTVCTLRSGRIAELRFFADTAALTRLVASDATGRGPQRTADVGQDPPHAPTTGVGPERH